MPPIAPPPVPGYEIQLESYSSKVKALGILWFIYGGLSLLLGFAALSFARHFLFGGMDHWMHHPMPMMWFGPIWLRFAWFFLAGWALLSVIAGWGLIEHTQWGRILAIIVAILNILKFPFGTALGIFTLVVLLGFRNNRLYEQL